jgi:chitin disaccharide deacetylase
MTHAKITMGHNSVPSLVDQDVENGLLAAPFSRRSGFLILNADDWGRDRETSDRILDCVRSQSLSSVSAMMFMRDSERAATRAREFGIEAGLHLNFTTQFDASGVSGKLMEQQRKLRVYLTGHRFARIVFNPLLAGSFEYVVKAQLDEFCRIYGSPAGRIDGHHHMHLCANVLCARLLPSGVIVRRNFSFEAREKSASNRFYRHVVDRALSRRFRLADLLFSLPPLEPRKRLGRMFCKAQHLVVEVETHPVHSDEHRFLTQGEIFRFLENVTIARGYDGALERRQTMGIA